MAICGVVKNSLSEGAQLQLAPALRTSAIQTQGGSRESYVNASNKLRYALSLKVGLKH